MSEGMLGKLRLADVRGPVGDLFEKLASEDGERWFKVFKRFLRQENPWGLLPTHIIDCNARPYIPDGWKVVEHQKGGKFEWNPKKIRLYLSDRQRGNSYITGNELRKELKSKKVLNACVLDWLLAHPEFIPEEWKGMFVYFWGTIYRHSDGYLLVRYLYWDGDKWDWCNCRLDNGWGSRDSAAVLKK